jgi:hypothetical protein
MAPMIAAVFIAVSGAGCVALVAVGLPGTWLMLGIAILIELVDRFYLPAASPHTFGWWTLGTCAVLSLAGELLETLTGAAGARRTGASASSWARCWAVSSGPRWAHSSGS